MKYIPQRKCIACQQIKPKSELLRMARLKDGTYQLEQTASANGRGAYICNNPECIQAVLKKNAFHRAFKTKVPDECYEKLKRIQEES